jgi:hypothetical protein
MGKTWQQRRTIANQKGGAIGAVTPLSVAPYVPFLAALEAATMGTYGTPKDGFDALMAPLVAAIPQHQTQINAMTADLVKATFTPGLIDKTIFTPLSARLAAFLAAGKLQLAGLTSATGQPSSPPASPPGGGSTPTKPASPIPIIPVDPGCGSFGNAPGGTDPTGPTIDIRGLRQKNHCVDYGPDAQFRELFPSVQVDASSIGLPPAKGASSAGPATKPQSSQPQRATLSRA